jgi:hypothetical protein
MHFSVFRGIRGLNRIPVRVSEHIPGVCDSVLCEGHPTARAGGQGCSYYFSAVPAQHRSHHEIEYRLHI